MFIDVYKILKNLKMMYRDFFFYLNIDLFLIILYIYVVFKECEIINNSK